jgi:hypothetical protein
MANNGLKCTCTFLARWAILAKHKTARLSSIDRDITQLQNRIHNLNKQNDSTTNH